MGRCAQTAYKRLRKDGHQASPAAAGYARQDRAVQGRIFVGIDPPRWRISLSVGKRLKKMAVLQFNG